MASAMNDDASSLTDLTSFQIHLLVVTADCEPAKGLKIKDRMETVYGTAMNHGRLYPNLDTLVDRGLMRKERRDRRTNEYTVTSRGRRELRVYADWVNRIVDDMADG